MGFLAYFLLGKVEVRAYQSFLFRPTRQAIMCVLMHTYIYMITR